MTADIAVILTTHSEGRVLVPTIRSLADACVSAQRQGLQVELIVVMDRVDVETRRVIDAHLRGRQDFPAAVRLLPVDNGDLGASRNDGIAASSAPIIAIMDGDNLIASNWLGDGHGLVKGSEEPIIAHVERIVSFGDRRTVWVQADSRGADFAPELLASVNYWDSNAIAPREVFESVPYPVLPVSAGYGPEDWVWNMATLEDGLHHIPIPRTVMFYRARADSLMAGHQGNLLPKSGYLASYTRAREFADRWRAPQTPTRAGLRTRLHDGIPRPLRRPASLAFRSARAVLRPWVHGVRRALPDRSSRITADAPAWLTEEWAAANRLEPAVPFLREGTLEEYTTWGPPWGAWDRQRAAAYWRLRASVGEAVDYVFIAPWVRTGGGDRVMLQYIDAVQRIEPGARVVLITTEMGESSRLDDVPPSVVVIELRHLYSESVDREWVVQHLLPQLLTQCSPRTVHVFNSTVGADVFERFGRQLSNDISLFVSTFVMDRTPDGERTSILFYRHPGFLVPVTAVLVDSHAFVDTMVEQAGFPREKFSVQRQVVPPLPAVEGRTGPIGPEAPLRVLWAGRFDLQKRLDVLAAIARECRARDLPIEFEIFGEPVMGDPSLEESLEALAALGAHLPGAYRDISELDLNRFDAFVLTSEWEGVPNTLLEVMASGLPSIAPLVGGIPEVLDESVGYPVSGFDNVQGYVDAFEALILNYEDGASRARRGRERVRETYSRDAFEERLRAVPGYIGGRVLEQKEQARGRQFVADRATRDFLASDRPRAYLFSGSGGYSNFGDILQPKNAIALWRRYAPEVEPVIFFHVGSARSEEHLERLRAWYAVEHIVFFVREDELAPPYLSPVASASPAPVHAVGGGFLNEIWGVEYLSVIEEIGAALPVTEYVFSGMQIDEFIVPHLEAFASRNRLVAFGLRDDRSLELASASFPDIASPSFDDLFEAIEAWGRGAPGLPERSGPFRLGLHVNASDYVGADAVIRAVKSCLETVLEREESVEVVLINAYTDARPEVLDTLASMRLFGDEFPLTTYSVVDIAKVALEADLSAGERPEALSELRLDAAVTCSYHTTMLMNELGIPAFLIRINDYYEQKARIFDLPREFGAFLDERSRYVRRFERQRLERAEWVFRIGRWMQGEGFPREGAAE